MSDEAREKAKSHTLAIMDYLDAGFSLTPDTIYDAYLAGHASRDKEMASKDANIGEQNALLLSASEGIKELQLEVAELKRQMSLLEFESCRGYIDEIDDRKHERDALALQVAEMRSVVWEAYCRCEVRRDEHGGAIAMLKQCERCKAIALTPTDAEKRVMRWREALERVKSINGVGSTEYKICVEALADEETKDE